MTNTSQIPYSSMCCITQLKGTSGINLKQKQHVIMENTPHILIKQDVLAITYRGIITDVL